MSIKTFEANTDTYKISARSSNPISRLLINISDGDNSTFSFGIDKTDLKPVIDTPIESTIGNSTEPKINDQVPSTIEDPITSTINDPITSAINNPTASAISDPITSAINNPTASTINDPITSAINGPTTSTISDPITSAISGPTTSAISDSTTSAISNPTTSAINNPITSTIEDSSKSAINDTSLAINEATKETTRKFTVGDPIIVVFANKQAVVFDLATNKEIKKIDISVNIFAVKISPDNTEIVFCCSDGSTFLKTLIDNTGRAIIHSTRHPHKPTSFAISPNRTNIMVAVGYSDGYIQLASDHSKILFPTSNCEVTHLSFAPDGKLLLAESSDHTSIYDTNQISNNLVKKIDVVMRKPELSSDNKTIYYFNNSRTLSMYDLEKSRVIQETGASSKSRLIISPNESYAATLHDFKVAIFKKFDLTQMVYWTGHCNGGKKVTNIFFTPDSQEIIFHKQWKIVRWRFTTPKNTNTDDIETICSSLPNSLIAVSGNLSN